MDTPPDDVTWALIRFPDEDTPHVTRLKGGTREEAIEMVHSLWRIRHPANKAQPPRDTWSGTCLLVQLHGDPMPFPFSDWEQEARQAHRKLQDEKAEAAERREFERVERRYNQLKDKYR